MFSVTLFFALGSSLTNWLVQNFQVIQGGSAYQIGPLDLPYATYFLLLILLGIYTLWHQYKKTEGQEKLQVLYMIVGTTIPAITISISILLLARLLDIAAGIPINRYVSNYHTFDLRRIGLHSTLIFTLAGTYAILRHRLFGIRVVLGKLLFWFGIASFLFVVFYLVALSEQKLFGSFTSPVVLAINVFLALVVALIFSVYEKSLRQAIERSFMHFSYDPSEVVEQFILKSSAGRTTQELSQALFETANK